METQGDAHKQPRTQHRALLELCGRAHAAGWPTSTSSPLRVQGQLEMLMVFTEALITTPLGGPELLFYVQNTRTEERNIFWTRIKSYQSSHLAR